MHITLTPIRMDPTELQVRRDGDALVVNGQRLDFAQMADGSARPALDWDCPFLVGQVQRENGAVTLTLLLPHGADAGPETLFPAAIDDPENGPLPLPPYGRDRLA